MKTELIVFELGTNNFHYAIAETDILVDEVDYISAPIERESYAETGEISKSSLTLNMPNSFQFAENVLKTTLETPLLVTVYEVETDGYVGISKPFVIWRGRVAGKELNGDLISLQCDSVFSSLRRPGLRAKYEFNCRHTVFDHGCRLSEGVWRHNTEVVSVTGNNIKVESINGKTTDYLGGIIIDSISTEQRLIIAQDKTSLTVNRPFADIIVGSSVVLIPGCDGTREICKNKFKNHLNFGGWPYIPTVNPFGGSKIM